MYLIYELNGGRVIARSNRAEPPEVLDHHAYLEVSEFVGDMATAYVEDGAVVERIPAGYLDSVKARKVKEIEAARDAHFDRGALTPMGRIQADVVSRVNVSGAYQEALADADFEVSWRMSDNTEVTLNAEQMIAVGLLVASFVRATYQHSFALKAALEACTTLEAIKSLDLSFDTVA